MDLEALNTKQLREKCLQYGLPNVPVTDTNRKILIRRLRAAMSGADPKKTSTPKVASPAINRRKTVHSTITTTVSSGDEDDFIIKTQRKVHDTKNATERRRTMAVTPKTVKTSPKSPAIGFESVFNSTQVNKPTTTFANDAERRERARRSVSLTKTGVLTTSYSQETVPLRATYEEQNDEDDYDEADEMDDVQINKDVDMAAAAAARHAQTYTHPVYSGYDQTNYRQSFLTSPSTAPSNINKLYPNLNDTGLQADYYNSLDGMRASHSSTWRNPNLGFTHNAPTSYMPTAPPMTFKTPPATQRESYGGAGIGNSSGSILNTTPMYHAPMGTATTTKRYSEATRRHTARAIDNEEIAASSSDDQYEAPYLSKFSRNLDTLKPEPLYKRTHSSSNYAAAVPKRRRATYENEDDITFLEFFRRLDQKYHLRVLCFFTFCFLAAVFVYVFLFQ